MGGQAGAGGHFGSGLRVQGLDRDVVLDGRVLRAVERLVGRERPAVAVVRDMPHLKRFAEM